MYGYGAGSSGNTNPNLQQNWSTTNYYGQSNPNQNNNVGYGFSQQVNFTTQPQNDPYAKVSNSPYQVQGGTYSNSYYQQNTYSQSGQSMPVFANLYNTSGVQNQFANQPSQNQKQNLQNSLQIWPDHTKPVDLDVLLKKKNTLKKQSDTSWVTYQEQSWKQSKPSDLIETQTKRKFEFPNPYIKYKIIPGVDQTMALDVTSKNQPEKGLYKGSLIVWDYHGGPNQQFYIHRIQKGNLGVNNIEQDEFMLINVSTGFLVSAFNLNSGSQKSNPNGISVCPKMKDIPSQRWKLRRVKQNTDIFEIRSVDSGNVLDCEGGSRSNGTNVIQWKANNQKNQMWKILPA